MTPITDVFIDIDGVLADFMGRYREIYGRQDHPSKNKENQFNKDNFRNFVETEQFKYLEPLSDSYIGISALYNMRERVNVALLGSIGYIDYYETLVEQKLYWLRLHNITVPAIFVPGKRYKQLWSAPNRLLIDDTLVNCEQWIDKGGIAIHHKNWVDTLLDIKQNCDGYYI